MVRSARRGAARLLLAALVVACGGGGAPGGGDAAGVPGAFRVAIVLPGPHDDHEWSQAGYDGLKLIERELGAEVAFAENVAEADHEGQLRRFAAAGYDFVIGHGGEFVAASEAVADEYPRTKFAVVALHHGNNRNLGAIRFREGEIAYLTGVVAALTTRTGKVAYIGGMPYRHMREQAALFARGARAIDPKVTVAVDWLESWTDEARAIRTGRARIADGFDVLSVNADQAGLSILREAQGAGVWAIGWNLDQHEVAPRAVVTSGVQRVPVLLLEAARLVRQGRWEGKQYKFGLAEGAQELAPFRDLLPREKAQIVNRIRDHILTGKIDLTYQEGDAGGE